MPIKYNTFEQACKNRKKDETTIYDFHSNKYRNIKIVRELKPNEYEINKPKWGEKMSSRSYKYYENMLENEVTDGDIMLFEWYGKMIDSYLRGSLTKGELRSLSNEAKYYHQ